MKFVATFQCSHCKSILTYEDEAPPWKTYDARVDEASEIEASYAYVRQHPTLPYEPGVALPEDMADPPKFVKRGSGWGLPGEKLAVVIPEAYRYVECPVCASQVKPWDGISCSSS
jgi:hypothetical protein